MKQKNVEPEAVVPVPSTSDNMPTPNNLFISPAINPNYQTTIPPNNSNFNIPTTMPSNNYNGPPPSGIDFAYQQQQFYAPRNYQQYSAGAYGNEYVYPHYVE